jgi:hypothetical protein
MFLPPAPTRLARVAYTVECQYSSAIIRNIKNINAGSAHMAYFLFDFKDEGKQDCRALLSSLIFQLCNHSQSYLDILHRLYSTHHGGSEQPSTDALQQCLEDILTIAGQVPIYLVIDAIDECPNIHGATSSRAKVLEHLKKVVKLRRPNLRLCVTSRLEMDIRAVLQPLTSTSLSLHEQKGQNQDIVDYVSAVVYSEPDIHMKSWQDEDKKLVIKTLSQRAGGM